MRKNKRIRIKALRDKKDALITKSELPDAIIQYGIERELSLHDRYAAACLLIPPMKRKSSGDDDKIAHIAFVEESTGTRI